MTQISGPINLIRMEGNINGIHKVFHIFMDLHIDSHNQTECSDVRSIHIKNYLVNVFDKLKKTDHKLDFFLEMFPDTSTHVTDYTDIYLNQMRKMFETIFKFNFKENKVVKSKEFPNVRLHYIDIRPYFTFIVGSPFGIVLEIDDYLHMLKNKYMYTSDITVLKNSLNILNSQMNVLHNAIISKSNKVVKGTIIRKFPPSTINYDMDEATTMINYLINKIKNVYKHDDVKQKINQILNKEYVILFNKYVDLTNKFRIDLDSNNEKINYGFRDKITYNNESYYFGLVHSKISWDILEGLLKISDDLARTVVEIHVLIMDLYFLRRALDKDYVTNVISYSGAQHSANYIEFLIQKFDFNITHVYYSEIDNIENLNKKIKNMNDKERVLNLFHPPKLHQCIDVTKFPENFT